MTLYDVLKVSRHASRKQIKEAYYNLSKQVHPDLNQSKSSADFVEISKAYSVLSNAESRRDYDATLQPKRVYTHRSRLDPNDYKLHKSNYKGSYNYNDWNNMHYPFKNNTKTQKAQREYWSRQGYQEKRKAPSIFGYTALVMIAVFFVNSGWVELMFL